MFFFEAQVMAMYFDPQVYFLYLERLINKQSTEVM